MLVNCVTYVWDDACTVFRKSYSINQYAYAMNLFGYTETSFNYAINIFDFVINSFSYVVTLFVKNTLDKVLFGIIHWVKSYSINIFDRFGAPH